MKLLKEEEKKKHLKKWRIRDSNRGGVPSYNMDVHGFAH